MRNLTASALACALLTGAAFAADSQTASSTREAEQPDATVSLSGGSIAAGVGYTWGSGELNYLGQKHPFKLSGLSIVDVGAADLTGIGTVYNLTDLRDFSGNYTAVSAGVTIAGGGSAAVLRNEHGVVIKLLSTTRGLRFNLSADGINIKLKS